MQVSSNPLFPLKGVSIAHAQKIDTSGFELVNTKSESYVDKMLAQNGVQYYHNQFEQLVRRFESTAQPFDQLKASASTYLNHERTILNHAEEQLNQAQTDGDRLFHRNTMQNVQREIEFLEDFIEQAKSPESRIIYIEEQGGFGVLKQYFSEHSEAEIKQMYLKGVDFRSRFNARKAVDAGFRPAEPLGLTAKIQSSRSVYAMTLRSNLFG